MAARPVVAREFYALWLVELRQFIALPLFEQEALEAERDMFLLQTLLLLRDSDLRQFKPHHVIF